MGSHVKPTVNEIWISNTKIETIWLFGEREFPVVEINKHQPIDHHSLPFSTQTAALVEE